MLKYKKSKKALQSIMLFGVMVSVVGCNSIPAEAKQVNTGTDLPVQNTNTVNITSVYEGLDIVNDGNIIRNFKEKVILDDTIIELDTLLKDNRKYVPIRSFSDNLGYFVDFNNKDKSITIKKNKQDKEGVILELGNTTVRFGDKIIESDVAPFVIKGESTTYVPLRLLNEILGVKVDSSNSHIILASKLDIVKDKEKFNALLDKIRIQEIMEEYRTIIDDYGYIGKNVDKFLANTEPIHKQGGFARVNNLRILSSDILVDVNTFKPKTPELPISKFNNLLLTNNSLIIEACNKTLNPMNWEFFNSEDFLYLFIDIEVSYLQLEDELETINKYLDDVLVYGLSVVNNTGN